MISDRFFWSLITDHEKLVTDLTRFFQSLAQQLAEDQVLEASSFIGKLSRGWWSAAAG
jgi:hypothetical protein